ncbi:oligosaccharide flippase family protein [Methylobacterium sp. WL119]|uniref:oligosaccharide flippase family protein n=1 Tax=unclassified Methylobacterium TaxID=2615210 RepID=UPI0011C79215|nr:MULTISPECIES: oligosaccharide flippase family protein [unclassified Methylobacterium]TXN22044.1 oligosaccharide flippase family protein [Methylobacterium sp. WL93]TXN43006.1 oligosaccharide flippase family protein [Methylobacterium sp. WL119]
MVLNRTVTSSFLVVGGRFTSRLIDLFALLILTRLLIPADFGKIAIALSLVSLIDASLEFPINQALLSVTDATREHYNTAFTLSAFRGLVLFAIANSVAYPYSLFYAQPQIQLIVLALSFASFIRTLTNPALAFYQRYSIFWRDVGVEFTGKIVYLISTLIFAYYLRNYWALVIGTTAASFVYVFMSYLLAPFEPKISFKESIFFRSYIGSIAFAQVISTFNWQFEKMLLGKFYDNTKLGIYSTSNDIAQMPLIAVLNPLSRPLLAAFAREKSDKQKLSIIYLNSSSVILMVALPILIGICLIADNIINSMFDPNWLEAIPLLQLLALSMLPGPFAMAVVPLSLAYGRSKTFLMRSLIEFSTKVPLMVLGVYYYGFYGVIFARLISELSTIAYSLYVVRNLINISISKQILCGWQSVVSSLAMVPAVIATKDLMLNFGWSMNSVTLLIICVFTGAVSYVVSQLMLWAALGFRRTPISLFFISILRRTLGNRLRMLL